jgi:Flp pilus assembly protein TadD
MTAALLAQAAAALRQGHPQAALDLAAQALGHAPNDPALHDVSGRALKSLGRLAEAEDALRRAVALAPAAFGPLFNLGNVLLARENYAEAAQTYRNALRIDANFPGAHNNLGQALQRLGRFAEAAAAFREAVRLAPNAAELRINLAGALQLQGEWHEAATAWAEAMRLAPTNPDAVSGHAQALRVLRRHTEALAAYQALSRLKPGDIAAQTELAGAYQRLGRFDDAAAVARTLVRENPDNPQALCTLGGTLRVAGHLAESARVLEQAMRLAPADDRTRYQAAYTYLLADRFTEGFAAYESRFAIQGIPKPGSAQDWDGKPFAGTVLIYDEQGLGDVLQFLRFVPLAAQRARLVLRVQPALLRLAATLAGAAQVVTNEENLPPHDKRCAFCSLCHVLGITPATLPSAPYLKADLSLAQAWRQDLAARAGLNVGLAWQGNPVFEFDTQRSLPLDAFLPLASVPGINWISLQKDERASHLAPSVPILDVAQRLTDMADTAALIAALDLVISVDSSRVHLAGALGKRTWVLNRYAADWRWHWGRDDSDWYPSVRQFRQSRPDDWTSVIHRVRAALQQEAGT